MKKNTAIAALFLNTIIWGGTFAIIKDALSNVSPMLFISFRFLLAALILLPFVKIIFKKNSKELILSGLVIGVLYFLEFAAQTIGLNFTSATKSGFITGAFVIFTPMFQLIIQKRKPSKADVAGVFIVVTGLIFLSSKGNSFFDIFSELGTNFNIGDFFTLISAAFYSLYMIYLDIISKKFDFMPLVFIQISVTGILGILVTLIFSFSGFVETKFTLSDNIIFAVLYTSILATIITTILQTKFQKEITPTKAGIILSFEPIFAAVFAFFVLSEKISKFAVVGCVVIFIGLLVSEIFKSKRNILNESRR